MKPRIIEVNGKKCIVLEDGVTLREYNDTIIDNVLEENKNKILESAKKLGIGKSTIYRKLDQSKGLLNG